MTNIKKLKDLQKTTGMPLTKLKPFLESEKDFEMIRAEIEEQISTEIAEVAKHLSIDATEARKIYFDYNCSVERSISEGEKRYSAKYSIQTKKHDIQQSLKNGQALLGEYSRGEEDDYQWLRVKKEGDQYIVEYFIFSKSNIESNLDLLYSDAQNYEEKRMYNIEDVFIEIEKRVGVDNFDTYSAYEKFPL